VVVLCFYMGGNDSKEAEVQKPATPPVTLYPPLQRQKLSKSLKKKLQGSGNKERPGSGNKERPGSASWRPGSASWRPGSASWRPFSTNRRTSNARTGNKEQLKVTFVSDLHSHPERPNSGSSGFATGESWQPHNPDWGTGREDNQQLDASSERPDTGASWRPLSGASWRPFSPNWRTGNSNKERPDTGKTERPDTGKTERPGSGSSKRPWSPTWRRPDSGNTERTGTGSSKRPWSPTWRPFSPSSRAGRGNKENKTVDLTVERPDSGSAERPGSANWKHWALRPATPLLAAAEALRPSTPSWRPKTPQWITTLSKSNKSAEVTTIHVAPPSSPPPPSVEPKDSDRVRYGGASRGRPMAVLDKDDVFAVDLTSAEGIEDLWAMKPTSSPSQRLRPVSPSKWSFPLHDATSAQDIDQMRRVLNNDADPNSCHADGVTALHIAAELGNVAAVKELLDSGARPSSRMEAVRKMGFPGGETPGHIAVRYGHVPALVPLLQAGAEVNARDNHGRTMLHYAAERGNSQAVRALLLSRADCNAQNVMKRTPLHEATERGNVSMVKAMIRHGANPHARDKLGHSPLNMALKGRKDKVAIAVINACGSLGMRDDESLQESLGSAREWIVEESLF